QFLAFRVYQGSKICVRQLNGFLDLAGLQVHAPETIVAEIGFIRFGRDCPSEDVMLRGERQQLGDLQLRIGLLEVKRSHAKDRISGKSIDRRRSKRQNMVVFLIEIEHWQPISSSHASYVTI